jgi:hypothetical protein
MPAALLASQFATLEPPVDAIDISIDQPVDTQVKGIIAALENRPEVGLRTSTEAPSRDDCTRSDDR